MYEKTIASNSFHTDAYRDADTISSKGMRALNDKLYKNISSLVQYVCVSSHVYTVEYVRMRLYEYVCVCVHAYSCVQSK